MATQLLVNYGSCENKCFVASSVLHRAMRGLQFHFRTCSDNSNLPAKFIVDLFQTVDWTVFPTGFTFSKLGESPSNSSKFGSWGDRANHSFIQLVVGPDILPYYLVNLNGEMKNSYRQGLGVQRLTLRQIEHRDDGVAVRNQVRELHELNSFGRRLDTTYHKTRSNRRDKVLEALNSLVQFENSYKFWASWARTYLDRTNICINLAHHLENKEMASQARRESISMFALAIVTVIFLPSTFSILGTNFFNFDGMAFTVSSLWWILPVASISLTLAVLLFWYQWSKARSDKTQVQLTGELPGKGAWALPDPVRQTRELMP
ncbi:hypothetical protein GGR58DRAFT_517173 [Xylaria digitata]|nr:hypothetical protein GGR58DRAFT_517173 [Xylaria digitata]